MNGHLGADGLIGLVEDEHVPGCLCLADGKVIFARCFADNYGIPVPLIVADQPHPCQLVTGSIQDMADDVGRRFGATTGMRWSRLSRSRRSEAIDGQRKAR